MGNEYSSKKVAITGVCGSIGTELVTQLLASGVDTVAGIDNNESGLFYLAESHREDPRVQLRLGDVRDRESLEAVSTDADIVFHGAGLKHVPLCEQSPLQAIQTNITGTQNVLDVAFGLGVGRVVFMSTDKAVNPTNVMGTSKLMAERLVTASDQRSGSTRAISTRFGNVLGSRGSVLPVFANQIAAGGPVTLTAPEMTRFIMTIEQAVHLVLRSAFVGTGGEVVITKMPIARIDDLAAVMIAELAPRYGHDPDKIAIKEIGPRPGEKLYEELMNNEEIRRSVDVGDFFVVNPAGRPLEASVAGEPVTNPYNSGNEPAMTRDELASYLRDVGALAPYGPDESGQGDRR